MNKPITKPMQLKAGRYNFDANGWTTQAMSSAVLELIVLDESHNGGLYISKITIQETTDYIRVGMVELAKGYQSSYEVLNLLGEFEKLPISTYRKITAERFLKDFRELIPISLGD